MKITAIQAKNFIGARDVDVKLSLPVMLFCGPNGSGKSSLAEALRMAMTGEPSRVSLKKNYKQLVSDGADVGYAVVEHDGGQSAIALPNGAHEHTGSRPSELLPFVLDAQRFAHLGANERRQFLFLLTGVSITVQEVKRRMIDRGCDADKVEIITTHLSAGSDAAHKESQAKARDAKASWRAVTGETYGSIKAASWVAPKPMVRPEKMTALRADAAQLAQQIEEGLRYVGDMQGRATAQAAQSARLAGLRERARRFARIEAKLRKDEASMTEWKAKVDHEERKTKALPTEPTYSCPVCSVLLRHDHANGALVEFTPPPVVESHAEPGKLAEYRRALGLLENSVANDKRDLADADAAAKALAEIDDEKSEPAPAPEEIAASREKVEDAKKALAALQEAIKALDNDERTALAADKRTAAARGHHSDVQQWETIAAALAPDGIPSQMLGEALGPVNGRLVDSAFETGWPNAHITADMEICADGRPYALLSESERWRVDAMIAETIAHLSGEKVLVLDRVDVLDLHGREDLLFWLDDLASSGEIDTCLLFATLKAIPAKLPERAEAVWIENGIAKRLKTSLRIFQLQK
jgi:tetratricopeptide (TPR) repeat protein